MTSPRRIPTLRLRVLAAALFAALALLSPAAAEPVDPALILTTLRDSLREAPVAERVRVTIKPLGKASRSDEFLIKVDPGKKPDRSDASVWIELGELRIHAGSGRLTAVHTRDESACYAIQYGDGLHAETLTRLLPPIPAILLALTLPSPSEEPADVSLGLTPYTPRITWSKGDALSSPASDLVTLTGARAAFPGENALPEDTRVIMVIDARTSRVIRFTSILPDASELRLDITPTVPGNPATWPIRTESRTKVASLTDLKPRKGDAVAANVMPELSLLDAKWNAWDYRAVFRRQAAIQGELPTHLAIVFARESTKDAFGVPSADVKAFEEILKKVEDEQYALHAAGKAGDTAVRLVHVVVPVMLTMDDASRRKVETAVQLRESAKRTPNIMWAPSPDRTIDRFAPGAAAVAVIVAADNSLAGIVLLDGRSKEPQSLRADLLECLELPKPAVKP